MSQKRKDSKGRILKTGELERPDGRYEYRYKDINGERRSIYDLDLHMLRKKEDEINRQLQAGVSYFNGNMKLSELLERYYGLKRKWKDSTRQTMMRTLEVIKKSNLYHMQINKIKIADCKKYCISLHDADYAFSTINTIHTVLKQAFEMAVEDETILRNPCSFPLKSIINDDTEKVKALTQKEKESLLEFLRTDTIGKKKYDMFVILLETGMRISEFAALTIKDVDFEQGVVHINKQLTRLVGKLLISDLKTEAGYRDIPMSDEAREAFQRVIENRKNVKIDVMISGYIGFLFVTRNGRPRDHAEYADLFRAFMARYNSRSQVKIERCTPHVLRHTFCTEKIASGMDVKSVQYLMGHSDASTTLNCYADPVFEKVLEGMGVNKKCCNL